MKREILGISPKYRITTTRITEKLKVTDGTYKALKLKWEYSDHGLDVATYDVDG